jgi:hypothetical protein
MTIQELRHLLFRAYEYGWIDGNDSTDKVDRSPCGIPLPASAAITLEQRISALLFEHMAEKEV